MLDVSRNRVYQREIANVRALAERYKGTVPILPTIFTPMHCIPEFVGGIDKARWYYENHPEAVDRMLQALVQTELQLVDSVKEKEVYYFDGSGIRKDVSPQSFTTEYSTDGETWQETSDGAAFRPNGSAESGIIQIRNTKKYYPMPETGGVGSDPFTVGGLAMVVLAAVMFLMHLRRQKKQA